MTQDTRDGLVALVRTISTIVGATVLVGGIAVTIVAWVLDAQSKSAARVQHDELRTEMHAGDQAVKIEVDRAAQEGAVVGRDVRAIKCMMLAPSAKAKQRCALDPGGAP